MRRTAEAVDDVRSEAAALPDVHGPPGDEPLRGG
jgi:hypothetical protein